MAPKLYGDVISPCVRAVLLTAKALNVDLEFVPVTLAKKEHLTEEFLKINPRQVVPTLDDDGFLLFDSHAIMAYICDKYGGSTSLYPKDLQKRATVHQMLHFEQGDIFSMHLYIMRRIVLFQEITDIKDIPEELLQVVLSGYKYLETFLEKSKFIAGNDLTIADFSIWTTVSNTRYYAPIDEKTYPNITKWMTRLNDLPYSNINKEGHGIFVNIIDTILKK